LISVAAVLGDEDFIPLLDGELDEFAGVVTFASSDCDDFALLGLFLRCIGDDDTAFFEFLLLRSCLTRTRSPRGRMLPAMMVSVVCSVVVGFRLTEPAG